jgi:type IV pilus assembly protein PilY1
MGNQILSAAILAILCTALAPPVSAAGPGSAGNDVSCCLNGNAVAQRLLPSFGGDTSFFSSQSNDPPNVIFILDNSTSMYEFQMQVASFPNTSFIANGTTPSAANPNDMASCHANPQLEAPNGITYSKSTAYPQTDPSFTSYFVAANYYKYMEWTSSSPGGSTSAATACSGMSNGAGSGGSGTFAGVPWSMTRRQRCAQCLDEAGYYVDPGTGGSQNDVQNGRYVFKGNYLNFWPPKFLVARKILTDFVTQNNATRVGVVSYDPQNVQAMGITGAMQPHDGGLFVSNGIAPGCNQAGWQTSDRQGIINKVNAISWGSFSNPTATPLAETLFNVGEYLTGDSTEAFYTQKFGSNWLKSGNPAAGGFTSLNSSSNMRALCTACQSSAVVLITDGEPFGDNNLPGAAIRTLNGGVAATCPAPGCGTDQYNGSANELANVAKMLANNDLNPTLTGLQTVNTYVIGLGVDVPVLSGAATAGKGVYYRANNASQLANAITSAVLDIAARATAFSSTAIQTLQVGTGSSAYVPRFVPGSGSIWEGHLYRFDLFNEFVAGVDKNGDGTLNDVFLVDNDGDIVTENDKGEFVKQKNGLTAVPVWDAGKQLQQAAWSTRTIYTAFPVTNVSGAITGWTRTNFADDTASATALIPYLGITGNTACSRIAQRMPGNPALTQLQCAQAIIDYVKGKDIFGENPSDPNGNRPFVLGDIFHSSPMVVDPPVDQFICSLGLHAQCASTLYGYQAPSPQAAATPADNYLVGTRTIDAYEKYFEDHQGRQRIVLVGANDGLLHAFDGGAPADSPPAQDPTLPFRNFRYTKGTGNELWAFVPPDQLPRLWLAMVGTGHQYYMDGDIMIRDIWSDGSASTNHAGFKESAEYHTVAIASEREGGTHFVALDVTDVTSPQLRWMWPPPCSSDEQEWGQTWGQFAPRAPPIGPILLQTTAGSGITRYGLTTEERWSVFLNGGHDPYNLRGRQAALLDVWTGAPLFRAGFNPGSSGPDGAMMYAMPATGAMIDYGVGSGYAPDGFFDTAVVGDEGGQVWTFRFATPGHIGASGLVDNWSFARAYESAGASANTGPRSVTGRQPIYTVASTTVEPENGWLRAFVGTGDRAHVRSIGGGDCRPDDTTTCVAAGCTVSSSLTLDNGPVKYTSAFSGSAGNENAPGQTTASQASFACQLEDASLSISVSSCPTATNFSESVAFSCSGSAFSCSDGVFPSPTPTSNRGAAATAAGAPGFLSLSVFADATGTPARTRRLNVAADAAGYDTGRLLPADLADITATTASTSAITGNVAGRSSAGWKLTYANIDEKTVTSSTLLGGCVIWNSLLPNGGSGGCASGAAAVASFYQADYLTGAPNCAQSFLTGTSYARSIARNVVSPPPEPSPAIAVGGGGTSLRLSTLEIQPGAQQVTQITAQSSSEMLQLLYSIPLTPDQHACRHVSATSCP